MSAVKLPKAPTISGRVWLNGPAPKSETLKGKVRLIYFFSIGEPASLSALPLLRYYDLQLRDEIRVIGVHAPRYEHDKEKEFVERALKGLEIGFPVVLDNEMRIWKAYRNQFWGQVQIVDQEGLIRHTHAGVNVEDEVEEDVFYILKKTGSASELRPGVGEVELDGDWYLGEDYTEHTSGEKDRAKIRYEGRALAAVMRSERKAQIEVRMDGKPVPLYSMGEDLRRKGGKTFVEVEGEKHLHVIKEDMDRMHEVEFYIRTKGLRLLGFFY